MNVDRTTAILSIRPIYADRILDGTKTVEFRRKPLPKQVEQVLIWRSGKGGGFVGRFGVARQYQTRCGTYIYWGSDEYQEQDISLGLWAEANSRPTEIKLGVEPEALIAYAGDSDAEVWGIWIRDLAVFPRLLQGWELGTDRAPQSWRYAHADWRRALAAVTS